MERNASVVLVAPVPLECIWTLPIPLAPEFTRWICTDVLPEWIRSKTALIPLLGCTRLGDTKQRLYCRGGPAPEAAADRLESRRATSIPMAFIASACYKLHDGFRLTDSESTYSL